MRTPTWDFLYLIELSSFRGPPQFFANAAAAEKALVALEKRFSDMENRLKQTSKASKKSSEESAHALDTFGRKIDEVTSKMGKQKSSVQLAATSILSFAAGYATIPALIGRAVDAQRQLTKEADETAIRFDRMFKKWEAQAGRPVTGGDKQKIVAAAQKFAVGDPAIAEQASRALIASGFSPEDASGGALDSTLAFLKATNRADQDPTELVKAFGLYMKAQGLESTPENLKKVQVGSRKLFERSQFQASDLMNLAGKSTELRDRMSVPEQMAALRVLEDSGTPDNASTALKIFGQRLSGAAMDKNRIELLRKIGLKPEDVDMIGESGVDVMETLNRAINEKLPETKRAGWAQQFFGSEASGLSLHLLKNVDLIKKTIPELVDDEAFWKATDRATSGISSAHDRQKLRDSLFADARSDPGMLLGDEAEAMNRESGAPGIQRWWRRTGYEWLRFIGNDPAKAASFAFNVDQQELQRRVDSMQSGASAQTDEIRKQTRVLEEIRDGQRGKVNRNAQVEDAR